MIKASILEFQLFNSSMAHPVEVILNIDVCRYRYAMNLHVSQSKPTVLRGQLIARGLAILTGMVLANAIGAVNADSNDASRPQAVTDDYQLLFIGNSHSAANELPDLVATMIEAGSSGRRAHAALAPGYGYLADRLADGVTQQSLESRAWSHVVLQAQKYSSSGQHEYPTYGAEEWIRRARGQGAEPILFPEWPRKGNTEEGQRVHDLHLGIASREPACVAPVGLVWEEAMRTYPALELHAADGNHSNINGATLAAFVFYQVITGQPASGLPFLPGIGVSEDNQQKLRNVAAAVRENRKRPPQVFQSYNQKQKFRHAKADHSSPWCF